VSERRIFYNFILYFLHFGSLLYSIHAGCLPVHAKTV
jgi:hypothetical protein